MFWWCLSSFLLFQQLMAWQHWFAVTLSKKKGSSILSHWRLGNAFIQYNFFFWWAISLSIFYNMLLILLWTNSFMHILFILTTYLVHWVIFFLSTYFRRLQSFCLLKTRPFLTVNLKLTFKSSSFQSTTDA